MIKDDDLSKKLVGSAYDLIGSMEVMLSLVSINCSQEEFENYRQSIASTTNEVFEKLIEPLTKEHPELERNKVKVQSISGKVEEDILYYDRDAPPMLERLYHLVDKDGNKSAIIVHIRKPMKSKDGKDWNCVWSLSSGGEHTMKKSFGVDAVQAFLNSLDLVEMEIKLLASDKELSWVGGSGVGLSFK